MNIDTVIALAGVALATTTLIFGFVKWRDAAIHARIKGVESNTQRQIDEIRENYAHRSEVDQSMKNVEAMVKDMKTEQHRMSQRMDEFLKWIMQIQSGNFKDG